MADKAKNTNGKSMTWLVVEDDYAIRNILDAMCELWNFNIVVFEDGYKVSAYLESESLPEPVPDIALLDIRIPGPWGHEVAAKIRQHPHIKDIGIVLMTAYELSNADREKYLNTAEADMLMGKPLPPMDEMLELVKSIVEKRQSAGTSH
ncbi:MAG: response regulator [Anaerolineae bacterium]|nr:response regulator [Anaerolineae bacterium]